MIRARRLYKGSPDMGYHGALSRPVGRRPPTISDISPTMASDTRLWCSDTTKQLVLEHQQAGETHDDVLRRLALEVEPESVREQVLQQEQKSVSHSSSSNA